MIEYNRPEPINEWAKKAVDDLPPLAAAVLLARAKPLIEKGYLRGDISEYWVINFPEYKDKLKDLYL